jgi:hypothetical protein
MEHPITKIVPWGACLIAIAVPLGTANGSTMVVFFFSRSKLNSYVEHTEFLPRKFVPTIFRFTALTIPPPQP